MSFDLAELPTEVINFLTERHVATLTTLRNNGSPHVVPVGFTYDPGERLARVITSGDSVKAKNATRPEAMAALCQVAGAHWLTLNGPIRVETGEEEVSDAVRRYTGRYKQPRVNPRRVVLIMEVQSIMGRV